MILWVKIYFIYYKKNLGFGFKLWPQDIKKRYF